MNATELLALYAQVADAPDAVTKLRSFVLELAVNGRLTDYGLQLTQVCALGTSAEFVMGQAPPGSECNNEGIGYPFVKVGEFGPTYPLRTAWTTKPLKRAEEGDVLICVVGATIGKLNLGIPCAIGRSVAAIRPKATLDQRFLFLSLKPFTLRLRGDSRGTAQGVIGRQELHNLQVWMPPLAEQHRIVAKVDELMALCDQLEAARTEREAARDRLAAASLARLNAPDPDTFQADAHFALNQLPALSARPDQVKQLRQTILNLAVRGKLTPQTAVDGPVGDLYERIREERISAFDSGRLKAISGIPELVNGFDSLFPESWMLAPLPAVVYFQEGPGLRNWQFRASGIPFLNIRTLQDGRVNRELCQHLDPAEVDAKYAHFLVSDGDILCSTSGTIGKIAVARGEDLPLMLNTSIVRFCAYGPSGPDHGFTKIFLQSDVFLDQARSHVTGAAQVNMGPSHLKRMGFPLPPIAEQARIVARVDLLMAVCDQLEESITAGESIRGRLLDSLLYAALESAASVLGSV